MAYKSFSFCAGLMRVALWPYADPVVEGAEHLPAGAGLVACNHSTWLDGLVLAARYAWERYRQLHMIAYAEPFAHPLYGYILRTGGCIPLDRRPDGVRRMMALTLGYLARGEAVGIFPEGHLTRRPRLGRARDGLALLALESGAPVIPSGLSGGDWTWPRERIMPRWGWPRRRMKWRVGPPLDFAAEAADYRRANAAERSRLIDLVNDRVMAAVAELSGHLPPSPRRRRDKPQTR